MARKKYFLTLKMFQFGGHNENLQFHQTKYEKRQTFCFFVIVRILTIIFIKQNCRRLSCWNYATKWSAFIQA
jgi:hypothetical protein